MPVTVSVIVPTTRGRPAALAAALRSVAQQDLDGLEIVVVNDGGGDAVAAALPLGTPGVTVRLVSFPARRGQATARNAGLAAARGRYVAFLDDDDTYLPGHLSRAVTALERTGADLVYADCLVSGDSGEIEGPGEILPTGGSGGSGPGGGAGAGDPAGAGSIDGGTAGGTAGARGTAGGAAGAGDIDGGAAGGAAYRYDFPYDPELLAVANYVPSSAVVCRNPAVHGPASWFRFDPELTRLVDWALWLRLVHDHGWACGRVPEDGVARRRVTEDATLAGRVDAHLDAVVRYEDAYRTVVARWPVRPGSRIARFRARVLDMCRISQLLLATGQPLAPFAYERALRVVHDGFSGRIDEEEVSARLEAALGGEVREADLGDPGEADGAEGVSRTEELVGERRPGHGSDAGHAWKNQAVPDI